MTHADYHADYTHLSRSMAEVYRRSPAEYRARYVDSTTTDATPTDAMRLGTLLHLRVLEPDAWATTVAVAASYDRRTKAGKAAAEEQAEDLRGRTVITAAEYVRVSGMAAAIEAHPAATALLAVPGPSEHVIRWTTDIVPRRAMLDRIADDAVIDLKTSRDVSPDAFARSIATYGYHRQAAWYLDAARADGRDVRWYAMIAIRSSAPYDVAVYELDETSIEFGRQQNRETINAIADSMISGEWLAPWQRGLQSISLPPWAQPRDADLALMIDGAPLEGL